jgi:hypothetical protein
VLEQARSYEQKVQKPRNNAAQYLASDLSAFERHRTWQ